MLKTLALALALVIPTTSCLSSAQKTAVEQTAKTCAAQDLNQILSETGVSLLSTVITYLALGPSGWEAALVALGAKYGPDAISCAVQIAESLFKSQVADEGSAAAAPSAADGVNYAAALANAQGYITRHPIALAK